MASFDSIEVLATMGRTGMVPVFYSSDADTACHVVQACYQGGVRCFEFANRGDFAHDVFARVLRYVNKHCPGMILGAGSVCDAPTAVMYLQMGANFIVGPLFNEEVARLCNRRCVPYIPGCGTVREVGLAHENGCQLVKMFPGDVLTPLIVKDILGPMPWTKVLVTGGVEPTRENLAGWFHAGTFCVGMGSKLFPKDKVAQDDWQYIADKCRECIGIIKELRQQGGQR